MGKSNKKKIKADQINVLRQQYDAFVEDDKKRKERNEHILDKLDKIRLSNTVARYKSNIYPRVSFNCAGETPIKTNPPNQLPTGSSLRKYKDSLVPTELDVLAKPLDETYIFNEISKKYILIPKLRSLVSENYIPRAIQDNNNDTDWKSKYNILDKLKQNEKEGTNSFSVLKNCSESFLDDIPSKEPKYRDDDEEVTISSNRKFDQADTKNDMGPINYAANRLAGLGGTGKATLVTTDAGKGITNRQSDKTPNLNTHISGALKPNVATNKDIDNNLKEPSGGQGQFQSDRGQYNYPTLDVHEHLAPVSKNIDRDDQQSYVVYGDKHENEDTEKLSPVVDDIRHVEVIDSIQPAAQETKNDSENVGNPENLEYPIDVINVKDFTPDENVPLVDGVNVNPEGHNVQQAHLAPDLSASKPPASVDQTYLPGVNQHPGGDHYVSEPTASEEHAYLPGADNQLPSGDQHVPEPISVTAEHKDNALENIEQQIIPEGGYDPDTVTSEIEAFEAEQNQMFYNEQADYQYQDGVGDVYSPETANYDPALYYAGVKQEAGYPAEINEHEESSQRYDPSYEEQYAGKGSEQEQYPQKYAEPQQYEQQYGEQQQYSDQQYAEQQPYAEQQQYGEQQPYAEQQQYGEQQSYAEQQQYGEQQPYAEQQVEAGETTTAQEYAHAPIDALQEQQTMEEIQQQLDNEEFGVPNQDGVGDIVDESVLYTQNAGDVATTEPYVENQNPQLSS